MHLRVPAAVCAIAAAAALHCAAPAPAGEPAEWLAASDLHLDPFDRSGIPRPGRDGNRALFESTLRAMRRANPAPALVVLPGDFLAHHFARIVRAGGGGVSADDAAIAAMRQIAGGFARAFPKAQFAIALGNNDAPCGDYASDLDGRFLRTTARIWARLVNRRGSAPNFERGFAHGGYYTVALPGGRLRLVVLNTVPFSTEYRGICGGDRRDAAAAELTWLRAVLRGTPPGTRNVVTMHVPPGYDAFSTEMTRGFLPVPYLNPRDDAALLAALSAPSNRVAFAIAGHAHRFDFRVSGAVPTIVLGALSPIYRNSPSFYELRVGPAGTLRDVVAFALDESTGSWMAPHDFDATWRVERLDAASLANLHARLGAEPPLRRAWAAASVGWATGLPSTMRVWREATWRIPWCAQTATGAAFAVCAGIERRAVFTRVAAVVAVLLAIVGLCFAVALAIRAVAGRRRRP
ncbi:MAG TPA: hypothetical protein VGF86_01805 [Candidatus Tumulicola sp.]|jgi:hypothetical protein